MLGGARHEDHPPPSISLFDRHSSNRFFLSTTSACPCLITRALHPSLIHHLRRVVSRTSNPVLTSTSPPRLQNTATTITGIENLPTPDTSRQPTIFTLQSSPSTPCAGLAHRSLGPHPDPTPCDFPYLSSCECHDDDIETTTHSRRCVISDYSTENASCALS